MAYLVDAKKKRARLVWLGRGDREQGEREKDRGRNGYKITY